MADNDDPSEQTFYHRLIATALGRVLKAADDLAHPDELARLLSELERAEHGRSQ